ncbi:MAG: Coenzyme F420 hydrogenase/dehydrogenase, beta subunit C-terminal domain [Thermodesulfobacteriota bacterium]|nr:Coenzyme F420 hydrogenase/dehydrogenase, beta subunit C-terminal domain [Thermodesulfobacteriota bacterium]
MSLEQLKEQLELSKKGFNALQKVIAFSCSRCGLCASLCPTGAIEMQETIPTLVGECTKCGFCYQGCPRSFFPLSRIKEKYFGKEDSEIDKRVGRCVDRFTSRSLTDEIFEQGATGGTATALLHYLLDKGEVNAVLHLGSIHEDCYICHHAQTIVSTSPEDTLRGCRSKNQLTPILHDLTKVAHFERFAVVGLSCHVEGLRKLQTIKNDPELRDLFKGLAKVAEDLIGNLKIVIGINCFASTKYGAIDSIYQKLGVREEDVIKYAEDTKKSLYQLLNEGKNFLWYVEDGVMTKNGMYHPFKYTDFLDETISMGCMVCPSFIVCKEADVSIGVTASDIRLQEFGYNSVFVRTTELRNLFHDMVLDGKLLRRPMWDNKGSLLRKFVEWVIPSKDIIGFSTYVEKGRWSPSKDVYGSSSSTHSGKVMGLQRLFLTQTVKRKVMYTPALKALKEGGKHYTVVL